MKRYSNILLFIFFTGILIQFSCRKPEEYPVIPHIENASITKILTDNGIDNEGYLKFSFTDGDGDIGLSDVDNNPPFDTASIYYNNVFLTYYERQNGQLVAVDVPMPFRYRIPVITPNSQNKAIKGDIEIKLPINNGSPYDTIAFEIYIVDRALNKSNIISTPLTVVNK